MVEGQLAPRPAIDAAEFVAEEQVEPGERRIFVGPDIIAKRDHRRQLQRDARAVHLAVVMGDDVDPLEEHRLDRGLPRPQRQRVIRQRRVIGVEHQRRAAFGMADQLRMIHASASKPFVRSVRTAALRPRRTQGGEGGAARLPLLPTGCQPGVTSHEIRRLQESCVKRGANDRHALRAFADRTVAFGPRLQRGARPCPCARKAAANSCCGSRISTRRAAGPSSSTASSRTCAGSGSNGTSRCWSSRSARRSTPTRSSGCAQQGLVYPCFCTRADIAAALEAPHGAGGAHYPGTCRGLPDDPERRATTPHSWRLDAARRWR